MSANSPRRRRSSAGSTRSPENPAPLPILVVRKQSPDQNEMAPVTSATTVITSVVPNAHLKMNR